MKRQLSVAVPLLLFAGILAADPIAITWTGTPTAGVSGCPDCSGATTITAESGLTGTLDVTGPGAPAWNVDMDYDFSDSFTLAAPAEILMTTIDSYNAVGTVNWELDGRFDAIVRITDAAGNGLLASGVDLSGQAPCGSDGCTADLALAQTQFGEAMFAVGTYTVNGAIEDYNDGLYVPSKWEVDIALTDPVSAIPEPRVWWLAGLAVWFWCRPGMSARRGL